MTKCCGERLQTNEMRVAKWSAFGPKRGTKRSDCIYVNISSSTQRRQLTRTEIEVLVSMVISGKPMELQGELLTVQSH